MEASGGTHTTTQLIGAGIAFIQAVGKIPQIARYNSTVLITGQTGTGKEVCARKIHELSPRAGNPFVPVNCGAIPTELAENELFGHKRGAFTGATNGKLGLIQESEGGTLFLDEVDSLPAMVQVKLLRFLQERTYRPLGATRESRADVRVIAAMNCNTEEVIQSGRLRHDLYYRLNVISLRLPPLTERQEDIPLLARHFLRRYADQLGKQIKDLPQGAIQKLLLYEWPGNVRELEHVIERAVVFCEKERIGSEDICLPQFEKYADEKIDSFKDAKEFVVEQFERSYITRLLRAHDGNISKAAKTAHKNRRAFWELIRKHGIDVEQYKLKPSS